MESIESWIVGSERLTRIFGYWPSFHDAEVLEFHFLRGNIDTDKGIYDFPILILNIHLWELTKEVHPEGYLVTRYHSLTTLKFSDVNEFRMEGFNHQNALMRLSVTRQERTQKPSPYYSVTLDPAFGMGASFECFAVEVVDAVPCTDDGKIL